MSDPLFHLKLLSNYQLVTKPGTYYVSVAYTVTDRNLIQDESPRYIVPLRAITGEGLNQIMIALQNEANDFIPFSNIRHLFLSGALWEHDLYDEEDLPIKGEKVLATFANVEIDGGESRLLCTTIELLPREELSYVDIDQLDQFRLAINKLINKSIN